jgi:hypothetical protein
MNDEEGGVIDGRNDGSSSYKLSSMYCILL